MIKTNFDHYYIEVVSTNVYKVYSDKTGVLKELKQAPFKTHKQGKNTAPYVQVSVTGCTLLHRLIADTFIAPVKGKTVNHKDGNPSNNALDNLEVRIIKIQFWLFLNQNLPIFLIALQLAQELQLPYLVKFLVRLRGVFL